jgi:hypothetical protein
MGGKPAIWITGSGVGALVLLLGRPTAANLRHLVAQRSLDTNNVILLPRARESYGSDMVC